MLKIIKGKKRPISKAASQYRLLKELKCYTLAVKKKKVSLIEWIEEKTGRGWWPAKWRKREAVDAQAARKDSKAFFQISTKAWTWLGPPKNYESEKKAAKKGLERQRRGVSLPIVMPVQLAIPAGSKQRQRGESHGMN